MAIGIKASIQISKCKLQDYQFTRQPLPIKRLKRVRHL